MNNQFDKREEFRRCLLEVLQLTQFEANSSQAKKVGDIGADILFNSPDGHFYDTQLKGPYAEQIQELLGVASTLSGIQ